MNTSFIKLLLPALLLFSCQLSQKNKAPITQFNHLAVKEKTFIISCVKCQCIIDELNNYSARNNLDTNRYTIYGDTSCLSSLSKTYRIRHLPQQYIDSCSIDFYNMLILTKKEDKIHTRMISTDEADKISSYLNP